MGAAGFARRGWQKNVFCCSSKICHPSSWSPWSQQWTPSVVSVFRDRVINLCVNASVVVVVVDILRRDTIERFPNSDQREIQVRYIRRNKYNRTFDWKAGKVQPVSAVYIRLRDIASSIMFSSSPAAVKSRFNLKILRHDNNVLPGNDSAF